MTIEIPYSCHWIDDEDIEAVVRVLKSSWLTTGPVVAEFEKQLAHRVNAQFGVSFSSGTAALHTVLHAMEVGPGDEVIVPAMTFVATSNAVLYRGATPVFVDVDPSRLLIDPAQIVAHLTPRTKAIIAVDYAGHPCDYRSIAEAVRGHNVKIIADACHALGADYRGRKVGSLADATVFSFHPVKSITTAEGGMVVTDDPDLAAKMGRFRNHGICQTAAEREQRGTWQYDMAELGFNYRLSALHAALGMSQLGKLTPWIEKRRALARRYRDLLSGRSDLLPLEVEPSVGHAYHLFVVRFQGSSAAKRRDRLFDHLRQQKIGVNVHYLPVYLHSYYRGQLGIAPGLCPVAEDSYQRILSLPLFPKMKMETVDAVVAAMNGCPS